MEKHIVNNAITAETDMEYGLNWTEIKQVDLKSHLAWNRVIVLHLK